MLGCQAYNLIQPLLLCAVFWLIFAIMGVQMLGGKFYRVSGYITNNYLLNIQWNILPSIEKSHIMYV